MMLTKLWFLDMLNDCLKQQPIQDEWRKANVVALLKPGKDPESPELQADRSPLLAVQASREDDPHPLSVQDRAQTNPAAGRFQTGEIVLLTCAKPHPAH